MTNAQINNESKFFLWRVYFFNNFFINNFNELYTAIFFMMTQGYLHV